MNAVWAAAPVDAGTPVGAAAPGTDSGAPTVAARVDRVTAQVGDVITLHVTSVGPTGVAVNLPTQIAAGKFTLLDRAVHEKDLGDGRMQRQFVLRLAAFEPGPLTVPPIELTYLGAGGVLRTVRSPAVEVTISSLLANEPEPALKPDAAPGPVLEERRWPIYVAGGLVAAGLGALLGMVIVRRLRGRAEKRPAPPPRPAHEVAFEKLDRVAARSFEPGTDFRPYYFELSEIIREYLGARYGFDSLELTTDELCAMLRRRAPRELLMGEVEGWLAAGDLVKFAKISPTESETRGALETAIRIVSSTRARPAPVPAPGAQEARRP